MNAFKSAVIILALGLALAGCSPLRSHPSTGKPTAQDDIRLSTGKEIGRASCRERV